MSSVRKVSEMAIDPVCKMEVDPENAAAKAEHQGQTYYFCAPGCKVAFDKDPELENLMLDPFFREKIEHAQQSWRRVIATAVEKGIPVPALATALNYYDGYRSERLPANLLQAQRDYFGAHTYERKDRPRGEFFHTNWTGRGGETASSTYNA